MKSFSKFLNSDLLNKLIDKKLTNFTLFVVKKDTGYGLYFNDKMVGTEILIAEFKSYNQYLRWLVEASIMRVCAKPEDVKKVRQIYKNLYAYSRDLSRKNPVDDL